MSKIIPAIFLVSVAVYKTNGSRACACLRARDIPTLTYVSAPVSLGLLQLASIFCSLHGRIAKFRLELFEGLITLPNQLRSSG